MAETQNTQDNQQQQNTQPAPKIVGVGAPELVSREGNPFNHINPVKTDAPANTAQQQTNTAQQQANADTGVQAQNNQQSVDTPSTLEDQMKGWFEKQGIQWTGLDDIKSKLAKTKDADQPPLTDEQKQAAERDRENRRLQIYLKGGGTIEQYAAIKSVASQDLKELSRQETLRELKAAGFDDNEADLILKERYYLLSQEDIDSISDEKEKEIAKKKAAYFSEKFGKKAAHLQGDAKKILQGLEDALKSEEALKQREKETSSKVEDYLSKVERKLTLQLGKIDEREESPIEYSLSDSEIEAVTETLKDPEKRNKFLYTDDGALNIPAISEVLIKATAFNNLAKAALMEGRTREVAEVRKVFPYSSPHAVGVGGSNASGDTKTAGKIVGMGKPEVVRPGVNSK